MLSPDRQLTKARHPLGRFAAKLRWAPWLTSGWIARAAGLLLIINLCLAAGVVIITQQSEPGERPISVDFVSFYAAGDLANAGLPALAYDQAAHQRAEEAAATAGGNYQLFFYPPVYLLLCQSLAALPYLTSFIVFEALTLSLFLLVMRHVAGPEGHLDWLLPVLAFSPVFWNILEGQNAFLTAALLGAGTLLADRRPIIAGMLLGAVCYKPHFGLLVPVALVAGGRWRSIAGATGVAGGLAGLSLLAYGAVTWKAYLELFLASGHEYGSGRISFSGMVSTFGAARLVGLPVVAALALQGLATLAAAATVAWIWRRGASQAVRAAALLSGTMVAVPMALLYDQLVTLVALAWLVRKARSQGFLRWEKLVLVTAFTLAVASFPLGITLGLPLAPLPAAMLLALCASVLHGPGERTQ
jgi:cytochrome c oxidase subunit IV